MKSDTMSVLELFMNYLRADILIRINGGHKFDTRNFWASKVVGKGSVKQKTESSKSYDRTSLVITPFDHSGHEYVVGRLNPLLLRLFA